MILSDRDLRALLESRRLVIEPLDDDAIQPSSIDLRVGHEFRVFANSRHPYIDVRSPMEGLTDLVEATEDEPFILHPGEFVLGSTLETVTLPDDMVGRLEGKSSMGRLGLLIHSSLPGTEPIPVLVDGEVTLLPIEDVVRKRLDGAVVGFDPESFEVAYHPITGWYEGPPDHIFEVVLRSGRRVRVTGGHNLFTVDREGRLQKVRTHELTPGTRVAIPRQVPDPPAPRTRPVLDLLALAPESAYQELTLTGPAVARLFAEQPDAVASSLTTAGFRHVAYYRAQARLPLTVARQLCDLRGVVGPEDRLEVRGSPGPGLPLRIEIDDELAWLLGLYVAEGSHRRDQVVWSNTDQDILDRAQRALEGLGLQVHRARGAVVCCSTLVSHLVSWIGVGQYAREKRVPSAAYGWPRDLLLAFLGGFVDGDGSREPTRTSLWSSSERLVGDWLFLAARLGRRASASSRLRTTGPAWQVTMPLRDGVSPDRLRLLDRVVDGDVAWDIVVEVRDTGREEAIFDLEVRPGGRRVENFVAGYGGVFVSNTAGFVDAGFSGHLTLELSNVARLPITIYPGMRIGQLALFQMSSPAERPYGSGELRSKYQGQRGPTPSRYFENFDRPPRSGPSPTEA